MSGGGFTPDAMAHRRTEYKVAGTVYRDTIRRACLARPLLGPREWAVLTAVLALTTSYSKLDDSTTARQIAALAYGIDRDEVHGYQRKRAREILARLEKRGLVLVTPCGRGRGARLIVSVFAEMTPVVGAIDDSDDSNGEEMTPAAVENDPYERAEMTPTSAAHLEALEVLPREELPQQKKEPKAKRDKPLVAFCGECWTENESRVLADQCRRGHRDVLMAVAS